VRREKFSEVEASVRGEGKVVLWGEGGELHWLFFAKKNNRQVGGIQKDEGRQRG